MDIKLCCTCNEQCGHPHRYWDKCDNWKTILNHKEQLLVLQQEIEIMEDELKNLKKLFKIHKTRLSNPSIF